MASRQLHQVGHVIHRLFIVLAAFTFVTIPPTSAAGSDPCTGSTTFQTAEVICVVPENSNGSSQQALSSENVVAVPHCEIGGQELCTQNTPCFEGENEGELYDISVNGEPRGAVCITEQKATEARIITPGQVLQAMRRLTWSTSPMLIQPPGGETLVNFETNFYTDNTDPVTQTVTLLGQRVSIEAMPAEYTWHFDADATVTTADPGSEYPNLDITHQYSTAGTVAPAVDTVYSGRYRIGNGPWASIPGTHTVPGPPASLRVLEATPRLVG